MCPSWYPFVKNSATPPFYTKNYSTCSQIHPVPFLSTKNRFIFFRHSTPTVLFAAFFWMMIIEPNLCLASPDTTRPEPRKSLRNLMNPDSLSAINFSVIPIPIVASSPETGVRFGISLDYFFNAKDKSAKDKNEARASFVYGIITYSTRGQLDLSGVWQVFTKGEKYVLRGRAGYSSFFERVWGIGMNTVQENDFWELRYQRTFAENRIYRQWKNNWYGGISVNFNRTFEVRYSKPLSPEFNYTDGVNGSTVLGVGPALLHDSRDFPFSARKGTYLETLYQTYLPVSSTPFVYQEWILDFRKFRPIGKENSFGYQFFTHNTFGNVPLRELPRVGNASILRGFFGGRYRNKSLMAAQSEYRFQIWKWVHASLFTAGGFSASAIGDYHLPDFLWTGGAGLRFLVNKKNRMFVRMDYARNSTFGGAFYLRLNDAF